jgi:hypothetical protein
MDVTDGPAVVPAEAQEEARVAQLAALDGTVRHVRRGRRTEAALVLLPVATPQLAVAPSGQVTRHLNRLGQ